MFSNKIWFVLHCPQKWGFIQIRAIVENIWGVFSFIHMELYSFLSTMITKKLFGFIFIKLVRFSSNPYLTNYGKKKSRINIQDLGLSIKCGCIMCTIIVYWWITNFLVCLICQKLENCTFMSNLRVKTSKLSPDKHIFSVGRRDSQYPSNFLKSLEISIVSIIS